MAGAVIIGLMAGFLMPFAIIFFDKIRIDDPVGAISVHLVSGTWGTFAVGLFHSELGLFYGGGLTQLLMQMIGIASVGIYVIIGSTTFLYLIKSLVDLRVSNQDEYNGLDLSEHGMECYPDFNIKSN